MTGGKQPGPIHLSPEKEQGAMPTKEGGLLGFLAEGIQAACRVSHLPLPAFWTLLHLPAQPGWHLRSTSRLARHREKSAPLPRPKKILPGLQLALEASLVGTAAHLVSAGFNAGQPAVTSQEATAVIVRWRP